VIAPRLLDEDLQRGGNISLSEYTVLMNLSEAPTGRLSVSELADRALSLRKPDDAAGRATGI
jgi:hypothetical protein